MDMQMPTIWVCHHCPKHFTAPGLRQLYAFDYAL